MRNLKKVLALTLAIALVLSLSVTAGAVKFSDKGDISARYQDAVDLMSELAIMNGFPDGTYQPQGDLTRAQYLKMLYVVMNRGVDDLAVLYKDVQPFPFYDVRDYDWFNGYVKWGFGRQIVSGRGGGVFDPNGTVTGFEALKMSLTALGYSTEIEGYLGDTYKTNVLNDAQDAGLLVDLETANLNAVLPREQAAQMLFNTLFAQMVNYNTTYIPAKMEKGQTMAYTYYNLYILRGIVVSNEWAAVTTTGSRNLVNETTISVSDTNVPRDITGNAIGNLSGSTYDYILPYKAPIEMLGHEVLVYARYANNYSVRPFDKVYGEMLKSERSKETVKYAQKDVTGALNVTTANTDLGYYVTNGDYGLNATWANVIDSTAVLPTNRTQVINNFSNIGQAGTVTLKQGSPIKFIDNDNNGIYDYVIATSMTYAKVTNVTDAGAVTAFAGEKAHAAFTGTAVLSTTAAANIYLGYNEAGTERSEALKVDDRALVYDLPGSKKGILPVKAMLGTLTSTNGNKEGAARATISGTTYKNWLFNSAIDELEDTAVSANFSAEKEWRFFGSYLLEGPAVDTTPAQWALVLDSYIHGSSSFNTYTAQVKLLLEDGSVNVYELNGIYDKDGNKQTLYKDNINEKVRVGADVSANTLGNLLVDNVASLNTTYNIFRATISEDEKSVTLDMWDAAEGALGTDNQHAYKQSGITNNSLIQIANGSTKGVLNNTVFFVVNNKNTTTRAGVYAGRNMPSFTGANTKARGVLANINGGANATGDYIRAAVYLTKDIEVVNHIGKYAMVVGDPKVSYDSAAGKYVAELELFDGTETKVYTAIAGLKSNLVTSGYTTYSINTIGGTNLSSVGDLNVANGDIVEYGLNAAGKINALVTIRAFADNPANTNADGVYKGYYVVGGTGWINFYGNKVLPAIGSLAQNVDAKFFNMTDKVGVATSGWPNATSNSAKFARILRVDGLVVAAWVDTKNAGWNTGATTSTSASNLTGLPNSTYSRVSTPALVSTNNFCFVPGSNELTYWPLTSPVTTAATTIVITNTDEIAFLNSLSVTAAPADSFVMSSGKVAQINANGTHSIPLDKNFLASTLVVNNSGTAGTSNQIVTLTGNTNGLMLQAATATNDFTITNLAVTGAVVINSAMDALTVGNTSGAVAADYQSIIAQADVAITGIVNNMTVNAGIVTAASAVKGNVIVNGGTSFTPSAEIDGSVTVNGGTFISANQPITGGVIISGGIANLAASRAANPHAVTYNSGTLTGGASAAIASLTVNNDCPLVTALVVGGTTTIASGKKLTTTAALTLGTQTTGHVVGDTAGGDFNTGSNFSGTAESTGGVITLGDVFNGIVRISTGGDVPALGGMKSGTLNIELLAATILGDKPAGGSINNVTVAASSTLYDGMYIVGSVTISGTATLSLGDANVSIGSLVVNENLTFANALITVRGTTTIAANKQLTNAALAHKYQGGVFGSNGAKFVTAAVTGPDNTIVGMTNNAANFYDASGAKEAVQLSKTYTWDAIVGGAGQAAGASGWQYP